MIPGYFQLFLLKHSKRLFTNSKSQRHWEKKKWSIREESCVKNVSVEKWSIYFSSSSGLLLVPWRGTTRESSSFRVTQKVLHIIKVFVSRRHIPVHPRAFEQTLLFVAVLSQPPCRKIKIYLLLLPDLFYSQLQRTDILWLCEVSPAHQLCCTWKCVWLTITSKRQLI